MRRLVLKETRVEGDNNLVGNVMNYYVCSLKEWTPPEPIKSWSNARYVVFGIPWWWLGDQRSKEKSPKLKIRNLLNFRPSDFDPQDWFSYSISQ